MFIAAFTSRSWVVPQPHVQVRTVSGVVSRKVPQAEYNLEDGNQRSIAAANRLSLPRSAGSSFSLASGRCSHPRLKPGVSTKESPGDDGAWNR